ncbi:glutamine synthetase family protein [Streptomyces uncialis]|uniref:Glutamine synthetase n=1 Tax=Streptomyces uncialis TaxID=1048205 RepID=A0A1Q4V508_9ACTN|nr:glutamine synthetase family protein [Streptomyces uncialis]OKH92907.1 glutamine synthetase [Streptomyces uncialis]
MGASDRRTAADGEAEARAAQLAARGVEMVAMTIVDNAGICRAKTFPLARLPQVAERGVGMAPCFDVYTSADRMVTSPHLGGPDGDLRLFPDLDRLVPLTAQPGWAWSPADRYEQDGRVYASCQRLFARRMADRAAALGLRLSMGYETEWTLRRPDGSCPTTGPAYGMSRVVELSDYGRDLVRALDEQGVRVLQFHPEYSPGQFEVSTAPADGPVAAADDVVLVRETIRGVSARHGLRASFAPTFLAGGVGNGCHLHLSLHRGTTALHRDPTAPYGLAPDAAAFLAGVLERLPALVAVGAGTPASGLRLEPSRWAGAYRCWGVENREAALRLVPGDGHAELKCFDATANPYLLAGSVIAAGLAGVAQGVKLPEPVVGDPATLTGVPRLPLSPDEAIGQLEASDVLREAMGEVLYEAVLAVRRAESEDFAGRAPDEIAAGTRWRY